MCYRKRKLVAGLTVILRRLPLPSLCAMESTEALRKKPLPSHHSDRTLCCLTLAIVELTLHMMVSGWCLLGACSSRGNSTLVKQASQRAPSIQLSAGASNARCRYAHALFDTCEVITILIFLSMTFLCRRTENIAP